MTHSQAIEHAPLYNAFTFLLDLAEVAIIGFVLALQGVR